MNGTLVGRVFALIIVLGAAIGGWALYSRAKPDPSAKNTLSGDQGILGRPLRVGIVSWPGFAGGLVANKGFKPNRECIFWRGQKLLVEFTLVEDTDARTAALEKGGPDGLDMVWSTVDFLAQELPRLRKDGVNCRAVMQVDWSRGGDAIITSGDIHRVEDLADKRISLALSTPSNWLLEYSLQNSSLSDGDQERIMKGLVGKSSSPDVRADFVAGKIDVAVVWEPDVTECLRKRPGSQVLVSTKSASNLIADLMMAREDFIREHPEVIRAFVNGWLEGTAEAVRHPDLAVDALVENEPVYKELGREETQAQLSAVKWADMADNTQMFGLDGSEPLFDRIFNQASQAWAKRGYISQPVSASVARDASFVAELFSKSAVKIVAAQPDKNLPKLAANNPTSKPFMTRPANIYFESGQATLDSNAKGILDQIALTAQTFANTYICVEGNADSFEATPQNASLGQKRAQSVVDYLVDRYRLNRNRFIAKAKTPIGKDKAKTRSTDILVYRADK